MTAHVLLIDAQNDFCDLPEGWLPPDPLAAQAALMRPQLPVSGSHADMLRVADAVQRGLRGISELTVTLDSHHAVGIERTSFWQQGDGSAVAPFTLVTAASVRAGQLVPRNPQALDRVLAYLDALEAAGRQLVIWTVHCVQGTWGHNLHAAVAQAAAAWENARQRPCTKLLKGHNPWTEHYSPFRAEVPCPDDPSTQLQTAQIARILASERIYVAGEAASHCVRAAVEDLLPLLPAGQRERLALVQDGMSAVPGFEADAQAFLAQMAAQGVRLISAEQMAQELARNA